MTHRARLFASLFCALISYRALAQTQPAEGFADAIEVRLAGIEISVSDARGQHAEGLTPHHFRLTLDGREVPIVYFGEVAAGKAAVSRLPRTTTAAYEPGQDVPTSYLVFVDETMTTPPERRALLEAVERQRHWLGPEDRVAVVAWDGQRLERLGGFSRSQDELANAAAEIAARWRHGGTARIELRSAATCRDLRRAENHLIAGALEGASAALRASSYLAGRKVLLFASAGWSLDAPLCGRESFGSIPFAERRGAKQLRSLTDVANQLGFTIYPIDMGRHERGAFDFLAEQTGGRTFVNARHEELFGTIVADARSYYWLGFTAPITGADRRRDIAIKLLRPELSARVRPGFVELSQERLAAMRVESRLLLGDAPETAFLEVELASARPAADGTVEAPLTVSFPADSLTLVPTAQGFVLPLELQVAALDQEGRRSEVSTVPFMLSSDQPPRLGERVSYTTTLRLRDAPQTLLVAVHDPAGIAAFWNKVELRR